MSDQSFAPIEPTQPSLSPATRRHPLVAIGIAGALVIGLAGFTLGANVTAPRPVHLFAGGQVGPERGADGGRGGPRQEEPGRPMGRVRQAPDGMPGVAPLGAMGGDGPLGSVGSAAMSDDGDDDHGGGMSDDGDHDGGPRMSDGMRGGPTGTVSAVGSDSITITFADGRSLTLPVGAATQIVTQTSTSLDEIPSGATIRLEPGRVVIVGK